jgi:hypothetical protein
MRRADVGKKAHLLSMRKAQGARTEGVLPGVRHIEAEAMAQDASANSGATPKTQCANAGARLLATWQTAAEALPTLRRRQQPTSPPRLFASAVRHLALPVLPSEAACSQAQEVAQSKLAQPTRYLRTLPRRNRRRVQRLNQFRKEKIWTPAAFRDHWPKGQTPASNSNVLKDNIYKLIATVPGDKAFRPLKDASARSRTAELLPIAAERAPAKKEAPFLFSRACCVATVTDRRTRSVPRWRSARVG